MTEVCVVLVVPAVRLHDKKAVLDHLHGLQLAPTLKDMLPELVCREITVAMGKLGLLFDHTYTWDVFSDMMVTPKTLPLLFCQVSWLDFTDLSKLASVPAEPAAPCSFEQRSAEAVYGNDACHIGGLARSGSREQHCHIFFCASDS